MAIKTRKQVREQLGSLLSSALTGVGNPAQAVYDYLKSSFDGQSPVVVIGSSGFNASEQDFTNWYATYDYEILVFVAREDTQLADDYLDQTTQKLYETLQANRILSGWWDDLAWADPSQIVPAAPGGDPYWMEAVLVRVTVYE
jgi:hypothetical protein